MTGRRRDSNGGEGFLGGMKDDDTLGGGDPTQSGGGGDGPPDNNGRDLVPAMANACMRLQRAIEERPMFSPDDAFDIINGFGAESIMLTLCDPRNDFEFSEEQLSEMIKWIEHRYDAFREAGFSHAQAIKLVVGY